MREPPAANATAATEAPPAQEEEDGRKNSIRVRIKQRKKLFFPTRNK